MRRMQFLRRPECVQVGGGRDLADRLVQALGQEGLTASLPFGNHVALAGAQILSPDFESWRSSAARGPGDGPRAAASFISAAGVRDGAQGATCRHEDRTWGRRRAWRLVLVPGRAGLFRGAGVGVAANGRARFGRPLRPPARRRGWPSDGIRSWCPRASKLRLFGRIVERIPT